MSLWKIFGNTIFEVLSEVNFNFALKYSKLLMCFPSITSAAVKQAFLYLSRICEMRWFRWRLWIQYVKYVEWFLGNALLHTSTPLKIQTYCVETCHVVNHNRKISINALFTRSQSLRILTLEPPERGTCRKRRGSFRFFTQELKSLNFRFHSVTSNGTVCGNMLASDDDWPWTRDSLRIFFFFGQNFFFFFFDIGCMVWIFYQLFSSPVRIFWQCKRGGKGVRDIAPGGIKSFVPSSAVVSNGKGSF